MNTNSTIFSVPTRDGTKITMSLTRTTPENR